VKNDHACTSAIKPKLDRKVSSELEKMPNSKFSTAK
jgi:hypothetical protein